MAGSQKIWGLGALSTLILVSVFGTQPAYAQMVEVKLPVPIVKSAEIPSLKKLKAHALKAEWSLCAKSGSAAFANAGKVRGWVLLNWIRCASKADRQEKKLNHLPAALLVDAKNRNLREGLWAEDLRTESLQARLWLLETFMKTQASLGPKYLPQLFQDINGRESNEQSRAWVLMGDAAHAKHDLAGAEIAFQQAIRYSANSATQEKLKAVRLALNRTETTVPPQPLTQNVFSEKEANFQKRFEASKDKNDPILQLEDALAYIRELPNGLIAGRATDRILEIHAELLARIYSAGPNADRWRLVQERAVTTILTAEPDRLRIWLPIFYRRGDYAGALRLGEKIENKFEDGVFGDEVLWYTARAAQLTGNLKKADKYFEKMLEKHGGSSLAREAELQWALVHLKNGNPSSAIASLEKLLRSPGGDKFELQARYWMVRAFESQQSPRAKEEAKIVIDKFPASYYGIRLAAEASNGDYEWPYPDEGRLKSLKAVLRMSPFQKESWDRFLILRANGYQEEAMRETDVLPLPEDPSLKVLWAQELGRSEAFPKAIRLLNEVGDLSPELRSLDVLRLGLPQSHEKLISQEAKRQGLNPILVRSLIRQESAFNPFAVSRSNALGLMQLIPPTAREVATDMKLGELDLPSDAFRPEMNVQMGSSYLKKMIRSFSGSVPFALAAYNAGPRRIEMFLAARGELQEIAKTPSSSPLDEVWFDELPWSETSFYVKAILRNSLLYKASVGKKIQLSGVLWKDLVQGPETTARGGD